jgi:hypothetical protein
LGISTRSVNAITVRKPEDIKLEALPYQYPMRSAVTLEAELRQIAVCMSHGFDRLKLLPLREDVLSVVGFGPSLHETWDQVTHPCITVSGAHDFLIERGFIPDFHAECDGRDHKIKHLGRPHKDVTYVMATICNPQMWEQLNGHKVEIWHNANGPHVVEWIAKNDDGGLLIAGGSVVGLSAIHIGGIKGWRKFKLFGFDGNFKGDTRHAGPHYGPPQKIIEKVVGGRTWKTTPQMYNAAEELTWLVRDAPIDVEVVGDSLTRELL